jgi:hypothetical protein
MNKKRKDSLEGLKIKFDENGRMYIEREYFAEKAHIQEHRETKATVEQIDVQEVLTKPIDAILDMYNDYMTLFKLFGDTIYQARAKVIHKLLQSKLQAEGGAG